MNTLIPIYETICNRIAAAARRSGRDPEAVRLVAVTKTHGPETVRDAVDAGMDCFGENKVQEAAWKIPLAPACAHWHLIGHLQSNKAKQAVRLFETPEWNSPGILFGSKRLRRTIEIWFNAHCAAPSN